jgi:hypothetical protein
MHMDEARDEVPMQARAARRARWPLGLGVAASVALALGLAWQLWPLPGLDPDRPTAVVVPAPAPVPVQAPATDAPDKDVPPATVASPEVRDAWLARIRALVAAGQADQARTSLQEFQRRYPEFELPGDLRALLPPP